MREFRTSGSAGGRRRGLTMDDPKRARTAETPKQPRVSLMSLLDAPYPDHGAEAPRASERGFGSLRSSRKVSPKVPG